MAAQVLSGSGNVSYTNSTGQNVRLVINYLKLGGNSSDVITVSFAGVSLELNGQTSIGKNMSYKTSEVSGVNFNSDKMLSNAAASCPTEVALANGDTFAILDKGGGALAVNLIYNLLVIPESG